MAKMIQQHLVASGDGKLSTFTNHTHQTQGEQGIHTIMEHIEPCLDAKQHLVFAANDTYLRTCIITRVVSASLKYYNRAWYICESQRLAEQMYQVFIDEIGDVGILLLDTCVHTDASCVVTTVHAFHHLVLQQSTELEEGGLLCFDCPDLFSLAESGYCWEESIIMAPSNFNIFIQSDYFEEIRLISEWIASIRDETCHVLVSNFKPIPVRHLVFPKEAKIGRAIYNIFDSQTGEFRKSNFEKARSSQLKDPPANDSRRKNTNEDSDGIFLIKWLIQKNFGPVIVVLTKKEDFDSYRQEFKEFDFNTEESKSLIRQVCASSIGELTDSAKNVFLAETMSYLDRGIAFRDSKMLPQQSEVMQYLFKQDLLQVLFVDFAFIKDAFISAKTIVLTDSQISGLDQTRTISTSEYRRIASLAGRPDIDEKGTCVIMMDRRMKVSEVMAMVCGPTKKIISEYKVSFDTLLSCLRSGNDPNTNLRGNIAKSLFSFLSRRMEPFIEKSIAEQERRLEKFTTSLEKENGPAVQEYFQKSSRLRELEEMYKAKAMSPKTYIRFCQPGRIVRIQSDDQDWGWGIVVSFRRRYMPDSYIIYVLVNCHQESTRNAVTARGFDIDQTTIEKPLVVSFALGLITSLSSLRLYMPSSIVGKSVCSLVFERMKSLLESIDWNIPLLTLKDFGLDRDEEIISLSSEITQLELELESSSVKQMPFEEQLRLKTLYQSRLKISDKINKLREKKRLASEEHLHTESERMLKFFTNIEFTDHLSCLTERGQVASLLYFPQNAYFSILLSEMILEETFKELEELEVIALIAGIVFDGLGYTSQKNNKPKLSINLNRVFLAIESIVARISLKAKLASLSTGICLNMNVLTQFAQCILDWSKYHDPAVVPSIDDFTESDIISTLRRSAFILRRCREAMEQINRSELSTKFLSTALRLEAMPGVATTYN